MSSNPPLFKFPPLITGTPDEIKLSDFYNGGTSTFEVWKDGVLSTQYILNNNKKISINAVSTIVEGILFEDLVNYNNAVEKWVAFIK